MRVRVSPWIQYYKVLVAQAGWSNPLIREGLSVRGRLRTLKNLSMEIITNYKGDKYYVEDVTKYTILQDNDLLYIVHWGTIHSYLFCKNYKNGFLLNIECKMKKIISPVS